MQVTQMQRSFLFKKNGTDFPLSDPNPMFTPEQVMSFYSNLYPELTTSTINGPVVKDDLLSYEFKTTLGTKG